jgi:uncharacterized protein YjbI with pentapeptide repeats
MANPRHVAELKKGIDKWNAWRRTNLEVDLSGEDLSGEDLQLVDFRGVDLGGVNLVGADLSSANLRAANLTMANLSRAKLFDANLILAVLTATNLRGADLTIANLSFAADLHGANLHEARLQGTIFGCTNLKDVQGLESCNHIGRSIIDYRTLVMSGPLPLSFLRGCGLPDEFIDYLPSLLNQPFQFYSCFISYSTKDQLFVERLHADLQNKNVRCWFAPHDLPIGAKTWDAIDKAIQVRDKVLLVLSQAAIDSDWVEDEVSKAYAEERARKTLVLFPIRIDDNVMTTNEPWARKLRDQRNIGDFLRWNEPSEYNKSLERLLRDLKNTK